MRNIRRNLDHVLVYLENFIKHQREHYSISNQHPDVLRDLYDLSRDPISITVHPRGGRIKSLILKALFLCGQPSLTVGDDVLKSFNQASAEIIISLGLDDLLHRFFRKNPKTSRDDLSVPFNSKHLVTQAMVVGVDSILEKEHPDFKDAVDAGIFWW